MPLELANRLFRTQDDLIFNIEDDQRAKAVAGTTTAVASMGDYSWFFTVSPNVNEAATVFAEKEVYDVSVAVLYKRALHYDATAPDATSASVTWLSGGIGGGDVALTFPNLGDDAVFDDTDWLMLCRRPGDVSTADIEAIVWYRIINVDEPDMANPTTRTVSLEGPDWALNTSGVPRAATAVIVPNVLTVYNARIER